jgi:cholesterol oxidase
MKTTRRGLLKVTAAGTGAAVAAGVLGRERALAAYGKVPNLAGKTAVVVGSGFGGAVAAYRLGQAGVRTTVLERGRRWDVDGSGRTFSTIANPDWRCAWFDDRPPLGLDVSKKIDRRAGLIAKHRGDGITVLSGAAVGGGSLVIGMFLPQPRRAEWNRVYPAGLSYDEMDSVYWPRARQSLGATPIPADVQAHPSFKGARAWLEYIAEFGQTPTQIPFAVNWNVIRDELAGRAPACHSIGEGPFGSNSGAKNSVDRNYLAWAAATGNVTVKALHEVTEIREVAGVEKFEVRYRQINEAGDVLSTAPVRCTRRHCWSPPRPRAGCRAWARRSARAGATTATSSWSGSTSARTSASRRAALATSSSTTRRTRTRRRPWRGRPRPSRRSWASRRWHTSSPASRRSAARSGTTRRPGRVA